MIVHNGAFDPKVFKDMITDVVGLFDLYKDRIHTYNVVFEGLPGNSIEHQGLDVMKEFDALDNEVNSTAEKIELDRYLEEKRLTRIIDIDVLDYWSTNQARFPNLERMAQDVLTILISTIALESAFSIGGKVLDQYRSCLAHNIVESLICSRDWKFNEEVHHNYTLEELTQDITRLDIKAPGPGLVLELYISWGPGWKMKGEELKM
ncbi:zinc finger BED domain-containing protein DAYSLEEPER-like [Heracleum sosnowskyi]|uniref:Zinc finger BED domain-containing protein DAYSLEEPER-like n=1 Tax=Heracleum sosnowskyi TaxID=360622 RepID=A0AAD8IGZ3_9APIA|nr:zinc finger BED domain-containing protein DAYSLEEPER-like [Heracleum sosnowskyi]